MRRVHLKPSKYVPANPIGEYGDLYKARNHDNGDRPSYGHGVGWRMVTRIINDKKVVMKIAATRPSKHRGARQLIS